VNQNWVCPNCSKPISIKFEINGFTHNCHRLLASELEVETPISLRGDYVRFVLAIKEEGANMRIALKEYGVIIIPKDEYVFVINGGWYE